MTRVKCEQPSPEPNRRLILVVAVTSASVQVDDEAIAANRTVKRGPIDGARQPTGADSPREEAFLVRFLNFHETRGRGAEAIDAPSADRKVTPILFSNQSPATSAGTAPPMFTPATAPRPNMLRGLTASTLPRIFPEKESIG